MRKRPIRVRLNPDPITKYDRWVGSDGSNTHIHLAIGRTQKECFEAARTVAKQRGGRVYIHGVDDEVRRSHFYEKTDDE